MRKRLKRHPASPAKSALSIEVDVASPEPETLALRYRLQGDVEALNLPPAGEQVRADELWRHTCFEAFVRREDGGYHEFNFAPSTHWAAYRFSGYREGMEAAEDIPPPRIQASRGPDTYELSVELDLRPLPQAPVRLGLSVVVEDAEGGISYWALAHPPGKPDFHHPDSFVLDLPLTDPR